MSLTNLVFIVCMTIKIRLFSVGKAKDLKKNVFQAIFVKNLSSKKTEALVASIHHIDTMLTSSETEALLLEHILSSFISLAITYYCVMINPIHLFY